jgi:hypothetical protein
VVGRPLACACLGALLLAPAATAEDALPGGRAIAASASVSPSTHLFGDTIVARLDVVLDPGQFDPDRLRVRLRFAPYEAVDPVAETRREVGTLVHLRYEAALRCLHERCIAPRPESALGGQEEGRAERHTIRFEPVEILYRESGAAAMLLLTRQFPAVQVVSRINTAQAELRDPDARPGSQGTFVASTEPPAPTYRIRPAVLAGAAFVAAFLVALFPAALLWRLVQAHWRAARRWRPLSPLERALVLVDWTAHRDDGEEDRRKALETLAAVLEREGVQQLAESTRALAWAEESPAGERAAQAGSEGRRALEGGGDRRA